MQIADFPFTGFSWSEIPTETHAGETGHASWQIRHVHNIRFRKIIYSPGYKADHWCNKGHIVYCLDGEMDTELADGRIVKLTAGMSYVVGDDSMAHRSTSVSGCTLIIVD